MDDSQMSEEKAQSRGKEWVRSFLFSVKIDSPLSQLHVLTKLLVIIALSLVIVRFIRTEAPDPLGALMMIALAFVGLWLSGVLRWVFQSYLLVMFPALLGMTITWIVFNPDPGEGILARIPVYSGTINLGISVALIVFLAFAITWYVLRKSISWSLIGGIVLVVIVTQLGWNWSWSIAEIDFYHPLEIIVSQRSLVVALTKPLGYGAMICVSLMLIMTTRDIELSGTLMQFRVPYVAVFFVSTMLRSLSMAFEDYSTIRQAQVARGVALTKRSFFKIVADMAYMAVPLTATMLRRSNEVGDAALLRGFTMAKREVTEFHEVRPFGTADWVVLGVCALFVIAVFVLELNFTQMIGVSI